MNDNNDNFYGDLCYTSVNMNDLAKYYRIIVISLLYLNYQYFRYDDKVL